MRTIIFLSAILILQLDPQRARGGSKETVWGWEGNGVTVLFKFFDSSTTRYVRCEMFQGKEKFVLAHDPLPLSGAGDTGPSQVQFCAKDATTFAIFSYNDSYGTVWVREFSIPEQRELKIATDFFEAVGYSLSAESQMVHTRGNVIFPPTGLLRKDYYPERGMFDFALRKPGIDVEMEMMSVKREGERWFVTMKIDKQLLVYYRADREAFWHLQMDDANDWLAQDPVLCGTATVTIDGEETTVQLWNQIAVRQNVEQQLARYKIPDVNFTWLDLVNADGSARRIWDAPDDELTFGAKENCGLIACYDPFKKQIAFAFQDRFHAIEYYEASIGQDLPKTSVLSRTQSYIQRTDGRGASPGAARYGRHMFDHLSGVAMAQPESQPLVLLSLTPLSDRMRCEATVDEMVIILELKDGAEQWEYRLDLFRRIERKQP